MRKNKQIPKKLTWPASADMVTKLQAYYMACDSSYRNAKDFCIFVSKNTFDKYQIDLANRNISQPVKRNIVFGTNAKLMVEPMLYGTSDGKVVGIRLCDTQMED